MKDPDEGRRNGTGDGYSLLSVGITLALTVTGSLLGGVWLDRRWETTPLFLLLGLAFGFGVGGFWFYQKIRPRGGTGDPRG